MVGVKLSDYVAKFLENQGIKHVFAITGGASLHLIDSMNSNNSIECIFPNHEQASAMAADAYARTTGGLAAAVATSGPGATNMITGICCAYYDSVPVIYITGQVASFRLRKNIGVRQFGFQETETVKMVEHVTKYAVLLSRPDRIRFELEKAVYMAKSGRPGPVLIDIPDDFQRADVDPQQLEKFESNEDVGAPSEKFKLSNESISKCIEALKKSSRPVLILGWGVRLAGAEAEIQALIDLLGCPILPTWAMLDFIEAKNPLLVGGFGTHGTRAGNFAIQNADLVISIGARLDTHETGSPLSSFARGASKIIVDIDPAELDKFSKMGMNVDIPIAADAKNFVQALLPAVRDKVKLHIAPWLDCVAKWKMTFPICPSSYFEEKSANPYVFVKSLSAAMSGGETVVVDTGCAVAWMAQAFDFKSNQRMFSAFNNTPMGYALPGAIGASFALNKQPVICVTGDGALLMNIQELSLPIYHGLPIKIFLINNHGYSMIQQTQDQWLQSKYVASSKSGGLALPDFPALAKAFGYRVVSIDQNDGMVDALRAVLSDPGAVFCNIELSSHHRVTPQVTFGRPIEDAEPLLARDIFLENMIITPLAASLVENKV